jgi:hypothetical protein
MTEIAKRAVACKGWCWMPGMLTLDGRRVVGVDGDVLELFYADEHKCYQRWAEDAEPDFGDPATVGCLLALVRRALTDETATVSYDDFDGTFFCMARHELDGQPYWGVVTQADTEVDALVAALEAAP